MSKSRIFLGGVVSASILAMGAAGPALASTSQHGPARTATSALIAGGQTGASPLRGIVGGLLGLPVTYSVVSTAGRTTGTTVRAPQRAMNGAVNRVTSNLPDPAPVNADLGSANVPGLPATGTVPGLAPANGYLGSVTTAVPGLNSVTGRLPGLSH